MTRKMLTATMLVAAMLLSVFSFSALTTSADAQGNALCDYADVIRVIPDGETRRGSGGFTLPCADAEIYPGPFTNMPEAPGGPYGWGSLNPVAGDSAPAAAPAAGGTGGGLAHTGTETGVLGFAGAGLIAFGAVALGSRRKFFQGALED